MTKIEAVRKSAEKWRAVANGDRERIDECCALCRYVVSMAQADCINCPMFGRWPTNNSKSVKHCNSINSVFHFGFTAPYGAKLIADALEKLLKELKAEKAKK